MESFENQDTKKLFIEHQQNKKLVSSELGELFANYQGDSVYSCVFEHFLEVVEDEEVHKFLEQALSFSRKHQQVISRLFNEENIPVPAAFGEQDVRRGAPRLFSDIFMVFYTREMARAALAAYGSALSTSYRYDIIKYFEGCLQDTIKVYEKGTALLLSKGMDIASPEIPYPGEIDFVEKNLLSLCLREQTDH